MKLTFKNYYTDKNTYLSNSKLKDFIKDKEYFYKKHIEHSIEKQVTPSMQIGSAVDCYLTKSEKDFHKKYTCAVLKKDDPELFEENKNTTKTVLPKAMYEKVMNMVANATRVTAFNRISKMKKQVILQMDMPINMFSGICGVPDCIEINGNRAVCLDVKTSRDVEPRKYYRICLDNFYFMQLAVYGLLIKYNYPDVEHIDYYHFVIGNNGLYPVKLYKINDVDVEDAKQFMLSKIDELVNEKEFKFKDVSFDKCENLTIEK